jgi:Mn2+/Fe2+ NRAMP family transporter
MTSASGNAASRTAPPRSSRLRLIALVSVVGPGLLAGLSDDDPAGITTYSVLGTNYGYQLLWVLLLSTVALIVFHSLAARMGAASGQGLIGLIRDRYGPRAGGAVMAILLLANIGTMCAELAGVAMGFRTLRGEPVSLRADRDGRRVGAGIERPLPPCGARPDGARRGLGCLRGCGLSRRPRLGPSCQGLVTPSMPLTADAILIVTATVGTTLAPWGLSFIQSYAVDKKLTLDDLRYERIDVVTGSV